MAIMKKKGSSPVTISDSEQQIYALDIGSSFIRLVSGIVEPNKQIKIQGMRECVSHGMVQGHISDINSLASQIAYLIQDYQKTQGVTIEKIVSGVPGCFIVAENQQGHSTIQSGTIEKSDRNKAVRMAMAGVQFNAADYSIIHAIPQQYVTESSEQVTNPIGMYAKPLSASVHVIGCSFMYKNNIEKAIRMTNPDLDVCSIIYAGNAASSAVLTDAEKEIGVIHVDIGGGTVNVTVYEGKRQLLSFGIDDGGNYITKMIAKEFSISMKNAEFIKCNYGCADSRFLSEDNANISIRIPDTDSNTTQVSSSEVAVRNGTLADVINRGIRSMCELIFQRINFYGSSTLKSLEIGGGIVLTGGTSKLPGIEQVFSEWVRDYNFQDNTFLKCNTKVRVGHPIGISLFENAGDPAVISDSDKAVAIGLLRSARFDDLKQYTDDERNEKGKKGKGILGAALEWISREL